MKVVPVSLNSKLQFPNGKFQINSKFQYLMTKTTLFGISNFGHWYLFVIWCL